jgi:hypothetical protein
MLYYRVLEKRGKFWYNISDIRMNNGYNEVKRVNTLLIYKDLLHKRLIALLRSQEIR